MKKNILFKIMASSILMAALLGVIGCGSKGEPQSDEAAAVQEEQEIEVTPEIKDNMPEIIVNEVPVVEVTPEGVQEEQQEITQIPEQQVSEEPERELCQVVHCNEFITLRGEPSTSGTEICKIPLGSNVYYLENAENGYVKIEYNGQVGYGLASYLNFTKEDGAIFMKVYNCQESITLRKIPSTKAEEFCQIPLGERVVFREAAENGFYMVSYNGYTGYALAEYLIEW